METDDAGEPFDSDKYVNWVDLHCKVCDITVTGEDSLETHLQGAKHRKKMVLLQSGVIGLSETTSNKFEFIPGELPSVPALQKSINECTNPLIGLEYIVENHCYGYEPRYQCQLCDTKMDIRVCVMHISGAGHRERYLESHHPNYYEKVIEVQDTMKTAERNALLTLFAREIESKEGRKRIKLGTDEEAFIGVPIRKVTVSKLPAQGGGSAAVLKTVDEAMRNLLFVLESHVLCTMDEARMAGQIITLLAGKLTRFQERCGPISGISGAMEEAVRSLSKRRNRSRDRRRRSRDRSRSWSRSRSRSRSRDRYDSHRSRKRSRDRSEERSRDRRGDADNNAPPPDIVAYPSGPPLGWGAPRPPGPGGQPVRWETPWPSGNDGPHHGFGPPRPSGPARPPGPMGPRGPPSRWGPPQPTEPPLGWGTTPAWEARPGGPPRHPGPPGPRGFGPRHPRGPMPRMGGNRPPGDPFMPGNPF